MSCILQNATHQCLHHPEKVVITHSLVHFFTLNYT